MSLVAAPRLTWEGRQIPSPPAESELVPEVSPSAKFRIIEGDNLDSLVALGRDPTVAGEVMLAYLDPPFLTGREHFKKTRQKTAPKEAASTSRERPGLARAFDDRWPDLRSYLDAMEPRLRAAFQLLAPSGSLILHVDPKTSHYLKVMCDELFGPDCFASEVIWRYRRWPSKTANFQRVHDVMLRYVKDPDAPPRFVQLYEPLASSTVATWGKAKQRAVFDTEGRRLKSSKSEAESPGTPLGDVWEIGIVAPVARERTGYPTQKPEALLRRLTEALTFPGDLVIDPYLGSGTTLSVAAQLGRQGIGMDESSAALEVARARLSAQGVPFETQICRSQAKPQDSKRTRAALRRAAG